MKRSIEALPSSPRTKAAVVPGLAERVGIKIVDEVQKITQIRYGKLHEMVNKLYFCADISYTAPGMHDVMTIWDLDGKKKLRKKHMLYLKILSNP